MAEKSIHIVDLKTADSVTGEEYLVLQDASGITYTQVTDTEAPSFEAGKYFQAQSDGSYKALETCPDNWQTMYNQCYTRTVPDTQKVPVKLITGKAGAEIKTAAEWESENPILTEGQIGVESDTNKLKIGDGSTAWNSLLYKPGTSTVDGGEIFNSYEDDEESGIYKNSAGEYAHAEGQSTKALGPASHAEGYTTKAAGAFAHAEGNGAATGRRAYKINEIDTENNAYKLSSIEGLTVGDDVYYSDGSALTHLSFGKITSIDTGNNSVATEPFVDWGSCDYIYIADATKGDVIIGGRSAHAEGYRTKAEGGISHAEGNQTTAEGGNSHAEGYRTVAREVDAHAEGNQTYAFGEGSHVEGYYTRSYARGSHVEGCSSAAGQRGYLVDAQISATKTYVVDAATIDSNLAVGTKVSLYDATNKKQYVNFATITAVDATNNIITVDTFQECTEGDSFLYLDGGPSIGEETVWGEYAHAEGSSTKADGNSSHAEGESSQSWGRASHAEGSMTKATKAFAHAEGQSTQAQGQSSHAEGYKTEASGKYSHAEGNSSITGAYGYEVKAKDARARTYTLTSVAGLDTTDILALVLVNKKNKAFNALHYISIEAIDENNNIITVSSADYTIWNSLYIGYIINTTTPISRDAAYATQLLIGQNAHAEGEQSFAIGNSSHAENVSSAVGLASHAEGEKTVAIGEASHVEGTKTLAFGDYSHAEGYQTYTDSIGAHAEGRATQAGASGYKITAITESDNGSIITLEDADEAITADSYCAIKLGAFNYYHVKITGADIKKNILPYPYTETTKTVSGITFTDNKDGTITINGDPNGGSEFPTFKLCETNIFDFGRIKEYTMFGNPYREMSFYVSIIDTNGDEHRYVDSSTISLPADLEIASVEIGLIVGAKVSNVTIKPQIIGGTNEVTVDAEILPILDSGVSSDFEPTDYLILEDSADSHFMSTGPDSHAEGRYSKAYAIASHAEGYNTRAMGDYSHAEGEETLAGNDAHVEGALSMALGWASHAEGNNTEAQGEESHAEGNQTKAIGIDSHAEGQRSEAQGNASHAEGSSTQAAGDASHAEGTATIANAEYSHTEGNSSKAYGPSSHAEGLNTLVSTSLSEAAHAEGNGTTASGAASHAEGKGSQAQGDQSHAEGQTTIASKRASHAEGVNTQASGIASHAEGVNSQAQGNASHAEGSATAYGRQSHAESGGLAGIKYYQVTNIDSTNKKYTLDSVSNLYVGFKVYKYTLNDAKPCSIDPIGLITGVNSDALTISLDAIDTTVSYIWVEYGHVGSKISGGNSAHAEGSGTAFGDYSHAEGSNTAAIGQYSHTEGNQTYAFGEGSHVEGMSTKAMGNYSHAEGKGTQAIGGSSHAEGDQTIAAEHCQHVEGSYNIPDYDCNYIHIVGNGEDNDNRSNAHTVDWSGNAWYQGDIKLGGTGYEDSEKTVATEDQLIGKSGLGIGSEIFNDYTNNAAQGDYSHAEGSATKAMSKSSHAEGQASHARSTASHTEGVGAKTGVLIYSVVSMNEGAKSYVLDTISGLLANMTIYVYVSDNINTSQPCVIQSVDTTTKTIVLNTYVEASAFFTLNFSAGNPKLDSTKDGVGAHAEGGRTLAAANYSHAEGQQTIALGSASHAEGRDSKALGKYSHAEGYITESSGHYSHAEGNEATSKGESSHAEGYKTVAISKYSHAEGYDTHAGSRGYKITAKDADAKTYTLAGMDEDFDGYSIAIAVCTTYKTAWTILDVVSTDYDTKTITVSSFKDFDIDNVSAYIVNLTDATKGDSDIPSEGAHAEGVSSYAFGEYSHSEGYSMTLGQYSHSEGLESIAMGDYSHVEGESCKTYEDSSHAEGYKTTARAYYVHSEGQETIANMMASHAEGYQTVAGQMASMVLSKDATTKTYTLKSVAGLAVNDVVSMADINTSSIESSGGVSIIYSMFNYNIDFGKITAIDTDTNTVTIDAFVDYADTRTGFLYVIKKPNIGDRAIGGYGAHAEGSGACALGNASHAEGNGKAIGYASHAESSGDAYGDYSHAEGIGTARGLRSHAEGSGTATGECSHAEGYSTTASGNYSHAEGRKTTAAGAYQHVEGIMNITDTENRYLHIVGNGKFPKKYSNAHTLDYSGNAWYQGNVRVGGTSYDDAYELAIKIKAIPHTTVSGVSSVSATDYLVLEDAIDYKIYGNSVQNGTPSAESPVEIQSVGDLVTDESSEYNGTYKVTVTGASAAVAIYLDAPLRKKGDAADYIDFANGQIVRQIEVVDNTGTKTIDESFSVLETPTVEEYTGLPAITIPDSDTLNLSCETAIAPSEFDLTYFQDINKVIAELKSALTQG